MAASSSYAASSSAGLRINFPSYPKVDQGKSEPNTIKGRIAHPNGDPVLLSKINFALSTTREHWCGFRNEEFTKWYSINTNEHGYFKIDLGNTSDFKIGETVRLTYDVYQKYVYDQGGYPDRLVYTSDKDIEFILAANGNMFARDLQAKFLEYENNLPLFSPPKDSKLNPHKWPYSLNLIKTFLPDSIVNIPKSIKEFIALFAKPKTVEEAQNYLPAPEESLKFSVESTVDMLLNRFPTHFKKTPDGKKKIEFNWDRYEKDFLVNDKGPIVPNVTAIFSEDKSGKLDIESITISLQQKDGSYNTREYKKGDPLFNRALYQLNCAAALAAEIGDHLVFGHIWVEQIAMAFFRSITPENPLFGFLVAHLRDVMGIDDLGKSAIFGEDGILNVSGLTSNGIALALKDVLASMDFETFGPRKPMNNSENQDWVKAENIIFNEIRQEVITFVKENRLEIDKHWNQVFLMSKNLVERSVEYRPLDGEEDMSVWCDSNELSNPSDTRRAFFNDVEKAMKPVTENVDQSSDEDITRLVQLLTTVIFNATFWHWSIHMNQRKVMTNLQFASLAPQQLPDDPNWTPYAGLKPKDGLKQLVIANILVNFEAGTLFDNTYGDVHPSIIEMYRRVITTLKESNIDIGLLMETITPSTKI